VKHLQTINDEILVALMEKDRVTFRALQKVTKVSPRILKRYLGQLVKTRLVKEEGRKGWMRGRKLEYRLTERGRQECFQEAVRNVDESVNVINRITSQMLSKPQELAALREEARHVIHTIASADGVPLEEKIGQTTKIREAYFGSFRKALRTMHQITLKLFTPRAASKTLVGDVYILINEEGVIDAISENEILKHPDISVTSM
jgi:predicted ArsR family transcriptional regulator